MSLFDSLSAHVPYLRRYGRALTGDQSVGDNYVRAALQTIADDEQILAPNLPARVALYQVFHAIWRSSGEQLEVDISVDEPYDSAASHRLMRISPLSRQAFLLTALEGFTHLESAEILGCDLAAVEQLIFAAQTEIEAELATDVLIIEDEPIIANDIAALVQELGHRVVAIATTRSEAIDAVATARPGLVLADVNLADGSSGIDAINDILALFSVPVIFITAFPERLLTGERAEPTFLITKPFLPETVQAAIGQALFFHPRVANKQAA